jgi:hypothetical protein
MYTVFPSVVLMLRGSSLRPQRRWRRGSLPARGRELLTLDLKTYGAMSSAANWVQLAS